MKCIVVVVLATLAACGSAKPAEVTPTPSPTAPAAPRLVGGFLRVTKEPVERTGCWDEKGCAAGKGECVPAGTITGTCGAPGCMDQLRFPACSSSAGCVETFSCVLGGRQIYGIPDATPHCDHTRCTSDRDCRSDNQQCMPGGVCSARSCKTSAECDGYCVVGQCAARAGFCLVDAAHPKSP
jgi:hypothetical protein